MPIIKNKSGDRLKVDNESGGTIHITPNNGTLYENSKKLVHSAKLLEKGLRIMKKKKSE